MSPTVAEVAFTGENATFSPSPAAYQNGKARLGLVQTTDMSFESPERIFSSSKLRKGTFHFLRNGLASQQTQVHIEFNSLSGPIHRHTLHIPLPIPLFSSFTLGLGVGSAARHPDAAWPDFGQLQPHACHIGVGNVDDVGKGEACGAQAAYRHVATPKVRHDGIIVVVPPPGVKLDKASATVCISPA